MEKLTTKKKVNQWLILEMKGLIARNMLKTQAQKLGLENSRNPKMLYF